MLVYLKKPAVQLVLFLLVVCVAGTFFYLQSLPPAQDNGKGKAPQGLGIANPAKVNVTRGQVKGHEVGQTRQIDRLVLPEAQPEAAPVAKDNTKKQAPPKPVFPQLVQFSQPAKPKPFQPQPPKIFAPRGMLIKAALVITLESNSAGTPVVAMVTEDVYFQGNLIVPAGTQVQGTAGSGRNRDRIELRGGFTFIWADGSEYVINGIALDHEPLPDGTFALTDGSAGIKGRIVKSDEYAELKILVASALEGVMRNQETQFQSIYGLVPQNTTNNAALGGAASGASAYAGLLTKKLEADTDYVQIPAGTLFYIFTTDVFEPELRSIAGLRQGNQAKGGVDLQKEAYDEMVGNVQTTAKELKQKQDATRVDADRLRQTQLDQSRAALLGPLPKTGGPSASPLPTVPSIEPSALTTP